MHGDENDAHEPTRSERRAADPGRGRRTAPKQGRRANAVRAGIAAAAPAARAAARGSVDAARVITESTRPTRRNGPARVFATVLVVPAIIGTVALPAYAMIPGGRGFEASGTFSLSLAEAQAVDVSGLASGAPVSSDAYSVTTKAEIEQAARDAEQAARAADLSSRGSGTYSVVSQRAEGDDYPWWNWATDDQGGGLSPLRYYPRECVDFVAWRLNRDAGVTSAPWRWDWSNLASGSAYAWADEWAANGWMTSSTPVVGSVAWFPYNHVAYVQAVNPDGTVTLEEYNWQQSHAYRVRVISADSALYLYPPG